MNVIVPCVNFQIGRSWGRLHNMSVMDRFVLLPLVCSIFLAGPRRVSFTATARYLSAPNCNSSNIDRHSGIPCDQKTEPQWRPGHRRYMGSPGTR